MNKAAILHPGVEKGYALDFISAIRHVATELDVAGEAGATVASMAASYTSGFPADLLRVRHHHGLKNDQAAILFLVERAVLALGTQVCAEGDVVSLTKPFEDLRYERRPIARIDRSTTWPGGEPFNPLLSQSFTDNIRTSRSDDLRELHGSMQSFGWIKEFPAIQDENGVTLVGHRRLRVAQELGIEVRVGHEIKVLNLGRGDEADAYRLRLAIASNLGGKPFTPTDRQRIAEHLYGEKDWTIVRISEALMVSSSQIARDLQNFPIEGKLPKKGPGRPKGSGNRKLTDAQEAEALARHGRGESRAEIAADFGVKDRTIELAIAREKVREEARAEVREQLAPPAPEEPAERAPCPAHVCRDCGVVWAGPS